MLLIMIGIVVVLCIIGLSLDKDAAVITAIILCVISIALLIGTVHTINEANNLYSHIEYEHVLFNTSIDGGIDIQALDVSIDNLNKLNDNIKKYNCNVSDIKVLIFKVPKNIPDTLEAVSVDWASLIKTG